MSGKRRIPETMLMCVSFASPEQEIQQQTQRRLQAVGSVATPNLGTRERVLLVHMHSLVLRCRRRGIGVITKLQKNTMHPFRPPNAGCSQLWWW